VVGGKFLRRRRAVREHLNVDARFVHFFEPQRPEIFEPVILLAGPAGLAAGEGLFQFVVPIMLFDGNDRTMRFLEQAALPFSVAPCAERGVVASGKRRVIRHRRRNDSEGPEWQSLFPSGARSRKSPPPLRGRSIREADREGGPSYLRSDLTTPSLTLPLKGGGEYLCRALCARAGGEIFTCARSHTATGCAR